MHLKLKAIASILVSALWISISEFTRNQFILHTTWVEHFANMGQTFPSEPINGAMWGLWSVLFSVFIYIMRQRFTLMQCVLMTWFIAFALMWIVLWNLRVLPLSILPLAVPLSLFECYIASLIITKMSATRQ